MYQYIARILPKRIRNSYCSLLEYSDIKIDREKFVGFVLLFGIGIAATIAIDIMFFFRTGVEATIGLLIASYILFESAIYMWLVLKVSSKAAAVERVLPDALMMMSMNIKAGMTTDRALLESAKPEFGPLEAEIRKAGKQILAGKDVKLALLEMPKKIRSTLFERTTRLIVEGIESGGELADLLQQTAEYIETSKMTESEVKANVMMYAIFIFFAAGIGAPLLFGISTYLVQVLSVQYSHFQLPSESLAVGAFQGIKIMNMRISISSDFLFMFSITSLLITSFFGGLIIGLVKDGEEKQGVKYIPILIAISLSVFFIVRMMIAGLLGGLAG